MKLLPSVTQQPVDMQIWQASGRRRLELRGPAAGRSGKTFARNGSSESRLRTKAAERRAGRFLACFSLCAMSRSDGISSVCPCDSSCRRVSTRQIVDKGDCREQKCGKFYFGVEAGGAAAGFHGGSCSPSPGQSVAPGAVGSAARPFWSALARIRYIDTSAEVSTASLRPAWPTAGRVLRG